MKEIIFDIETDGLLKNVSKIHCLSYAVYGENKIKTITAYEDIKKFFQQKDTIYIGHNIIIYDFNFLSR